MPKTVLFFKQIELVFQEKVIFSTKNAQFEIFQKPSELQGTAMTNKRQKFSYDLYLLEKRSHS